MAAQLQLPQPTVDVPGHIPSQAAELYQMTGSGTNLESRLPPLEQSKESGLVLDFSFAKDSELALTLLYPPHSPTRVFPILSTQDRIHTPHSQFDVFAPQLWKLRTVFILWKGSVLMTPTIRFKGVTSWNQGTRISIRWFPYTKFANF